MGQRTSIEWTEVTWNPTTGCTKVSEGCDNCYADVLSRRLLTSIYRRRLPVVNTAANRADPFAVRTWPERLAQPARWKGSRLVFVNSMSDLFHCDIQVEFLREVFKVMLDVGRHTYQVLTKRPSRAARFVRQNQDLFGDQGLPPHIWIGTSTENQKTAYRIRHLQEVPAAVRFLSCEPLIGPLSLCKVLDSGGIHWVIVGGESGAGRRPMDGGWVRDLREWSAWLRRCRSSSSSGEEGRRRPGEGNWRGGSGMTCRCGLGVEQWDWKHSATTNPTKLNAPWRREPYEQTR